MKLVLITCATFITLNSCTNSGNNDNSSTDSTNSIVLPEGRSSDSMPGHTDTSAGRTDSSSVAAKEDTAQ